MEHKVTSILDDMQAKADAAKEAANAAFAEAAKLGATLERLQTEAHAAAESARIAAEDVAYEVHRRQAAEAQAVAEELIAVANAKTTNAADHMRDSQTLAIGAKEAREAADRAVAAARHLIESLKPKGHYVRVEGAGFEEVVPPLGPRDRQVTSAVDGRLLDHVYDHPSGDWVYRFRSNS